MNDETFLRDLLAHAAATGSTPADRMRGVFAHVARRRRQRMVAASCAAVVAVFVAVAATGGSGASGLRPLPPVTTPTMTAAPSGDPGRPYVAGSPGVAGTPYASAFPTLPVHSSSASPTPRSAPVPGKLDIYVLLDNSGDMGGPARDALPGVIASLDKRLRADHVDLAWGLGLFTDQTTSNVLDVYHRERDIAKSALDFSTLPPNQGGGDIPEGDTYALDGAVGVGHLPYTMDSEGATFRPGATRVILLVTNAPMHDGDSPGYPSIDEAIASLRAAGGMAVGLQILGTGSAPSQDRDASRDLARVARGTGATARRAVDCDGDQHVDVAKGAPLVCEMDQWIKALPGLADALAALARR